MTKKSGSIIKIPQTPLRYKKWKITKLFGSIVKIPQT